MADPVDKRYVAQMNELAHVIEAWLNGPKQIGVEPKIGFVLLVSEFGQIHDGRVNYISNGDRENMLVMMEEYLARARGCGAGQRLRRP